MQHFPYFICFFFFLRLCVFCFREMEFPFLLCVWFCWLVGDFFCLLENFVELRSYYGCWFNFLLDIVVSFFPVALGALRMWQRKVLWCNSNGHSWTFCWRGPRLLRSCVRPHATARASTDPRDGKSSTGLEGWGIGVRLTEGTRGFLLCAASLENYIP
jgi:hypothetical protein